MPTDRGRHTGLVTALPERLRKMPRVSTFARTRARSAVRAAALFVVVPALVAPAWSQNRAADLASASLEDLMSIEVVSVSKTEQKLSHAASAVFVITQEDIRRSGAGSIPDLLRMVPGVNVAQIDSDATAVSVRGFNRRFGNKLLVLVDGRSVYTPTFGGVFWDVLDLPLEDIDRIEIIRGPGGSVWGANAVNGVINIITKKASDTRGALVVDGGGNVQQGFGTIQYGGQTGGSTDYRTYMKYLNNDHFAGLDSPSGGDGWHLLQGGFRTDSAISAKDTLTFEGNLYSGREGNPALEVPTISSAGLVNVELFVNVTGGFLQGAWNHTFSPRSEASLQISYDHYARNDPLREHRGTVYVEFKDHSRWGTRQDWVWGVTYRDSDSHTHGNVFLSLDPPNLNTPLYGGFVQDDIALVSKQIDLTVGAKLEHNYYSGFNIMPSARVTWTRDSNQALWAAVSDAVRSPAAVDASVRVNLGSFVEPDGTLAVLAITGNPQFEDESLLAYEFGYRRMVRDRISIDFATYYNDYDHLETTEPAPPFFESVPAPPHLVIPVTYQNLMHGETHGLEVSANWKVTNRWTLAPGYAFEAIHLHLDQTSQDTTSVAAAEGSSPVHSAQLRSHWAVPHGFAWETAAYFVDRLADPNVPSYTRLDSVLSWQFAEKARLSLVGQNLANDHHVEFVDFTGSARTTLIKRSAYAELSWQF